MKKILIVNNNLYIGGVQRALVDLLKCVHDRYDITLALFHPHGPLLDEVPKDVTILPIRSGYRFLGMSGADAGKSPLLRLRRSFYAAVGRIFGRGAATGLMALGQKKLHGFDVAVSYLHDSADRAFYGGCNDFVLRHTDAPRKVAFLHCDYALCGANTERNAENYNKFDKIAACSHGCRSAFLKILPHLEKKTVVVSNCHDYNGIWRIASRETVCWTPDRIHVLTVARFGKEKGVARAIEAFAMLGHTKTPFHYHIIGDGAERPEIEAAIRAHHLEDRITLLGEIPAPFAYMKAADLLHIPSRSEAAPLVIGEAASLGTPILSTETSSAAEMIEDPGYGWVCGNDAAAMASTLTELLNDTERLMEKRRYLQALNINNEAAVGQFEALIG